MALGGVVLIAGLGTSEILFILLILMLLFGAAKIPELARSLGKAQREFNRARDDMERQVRSPPKTDVEQPKDPVKLDDAAPAESPDPTAEPDDGPPEQDERSEPAEVSPASDDKDATDKDSADQ